MLNRCFNNHCSKSKKKVTHITANHRNSPFYTKGNHTYKSHYKYTKISLEPFPNEGKAGGKT